jgi:hypothetical protein
MQFGSRYLGEVDKFGRTNSRMDEVVWNGLYGYFEWKYHKIMKQNHIYWDKKTEILHHEIDDDGNMLIMVVPRDAHAFPHSPWSANLRKIYKDRVVNLGKPTDAESVLDNKIRIEKQYGGK